MSKVFSWKINDNENAYLFIPNKKNHLSVKITDSSVINEMVNKISTWDEKKYKLAFKQMNDEISLKYGFEIPYDSAFFGVANDKNVILFGSSKDKEIENIKDEILKEIDKRFNIISEEYNKLYNDLLVKTNNQMIDSINLTKQTNEETLNKLVTFKNDITKRFNKSIDKLDKATKVLELDDNEINAESLKNLYSMAFKTNEWVNGVSDDVKNMSKEYREIRKKLTPHEKENGVFKSLKNKIDETNTSLTNVKQENALLKTHIKGIENEQIKQKEEQKLKKDEIVFGSSISNNIINRGDFSISVNEDKIIIENKKSQNSVIIDDEGIKLYGNVYINGKRV